MSKKTALIAGATGLVGNGLLKLLLEDDHYQKVIILTRKPLNLENDKLEEVITTFASLDEVKSKLVADDVFCCLGTTMKKAGTKEKFREVDYEYPLKIAGIAKENGAKQYLLVSALGANKKSSIFYNKVKGEIETALSGIGYEGVGIFRPSLLLGARSEERAGEDAAKVMYKVLGFLFIGPFKKYMAIDAMKVSRAMATLATQGIQGVKIYESLELQSY